MENFLFEILMEISILKHGNTACKKLKTMTVSLSNYIDKISKEFLWSNCLFQPIFQYKIILRTGKDSYPRL